MDVRSDITGSWDFAELSTYPVSVKRTFIHIDTMEEDCELPFRPRSQSAPTTPSQLERCCGRDDRDVSKVQTSAPMAPPPGTHGDVPLLAVGLEVEIEGLTRFPDFNGRVGTVEGWDAELRRYDVLLMDVSRIGRSQRVKAKGENLRPCVPPAPTCPPRIDAPSKNVEDDIVDHAYMPSTPTWEDTLVNSNCHFFDTVVPQNLFFNSADSYRTVLPSHSNPEGFCYWGQ